VQSSSRNVTTNKPTLIYCLPQNAFFVDIYLHFLTYAQSSSEDGEHWHCLARYTASVQGAKTERSVESVYFFSCIIQYITLAISCGE